MLPICLAEIDNCRPYFIGLLGERYGFVPKQIPQDLLNLSRGLPSTASEALPNVEILHGVLRNPEMAPRAFFYFRDPAFLSRVPQYRDSDYASESPDAGRKLAVLKALIRKFGLHLREDYPNPQALGDLVVKDLWRVINKEYQPDTSPILWTGKLPSTRLLPRLAERSISAGRNISIGWTRTSGVTAHPWWFSASRGEENRRFWPTGPSVAARSTWPTSFSSISSGARTYGTDYLAILRRILGEIQRQFRVTVDMPETQRSSWRPSPPGSPWGPPAAGASCSSSML